MIIHGILDLRLIDTVIIIVMTTVGELKGFKGLKLVHMNCRSILNKIDEISYIYGDMDILACTETWLHKAIPNHMVDIPSMCLF